jgi:ATP-binding cassette subfamily F protein uup
VIVPEGDGRWVEYAGGYSDMLAQRGADLAARGAPRAKTRSFAQPGPVPHVEKPAKRRLNFKEKHALEALPKQIEALQANLRRLQKRLDDPGLYTRDRQAFADASAALAAVQGELAAAEERWLELEILREAIESG